MIRMERLCRNKFTLKNLLNKLFYIAFHLLRAKPKADAGLKNTQYRVVELYGIILTCRHEKYLITYMLRFLLH